MRILCDTTILDRPKTGVANALIDLYAACLKLDPDLEVEGLHRSHLQCALPPGMVDHRSGGSIPLAYWRSTVIPWNALRYAPDFIHFHNNHSIPHLFSKAIVVNTIHDTLPMRLPQSMLSEDFLTRYKYRVQRDLNRTDLIITISEFSRKDILKYFKPRTEPIVIHLASTLAEQKPEIVPMLDDLDDYFLYVGGYSPRKGLVQLLKTFLELTRHGKIKRKLILTGTPVHFSHEFAELLKQGVESRIIRETGYVNDRQLRYIYSKAIALVYPSKYEGFGLPPLEAMSIGCPVITTQETALPEICGEAALYADPDDPAAFADALTSIQTVGNLRDDLKQKGFARANQFTYEESAVKFLEHLKQTRKIK